MRGLPLLLATAIGLCPSSADASFINYSSREINVKIVYYGPATAGLAENLEYIYGRINPKAKGKLISLATGTERTLFFDFVPLNLGEIRGFKVRFHLYTVPGKVRYSASRKLILKGVDGVVFVADADPARAKATRESWKSLKRNLAGLGYDWRAIPLVVQLDGAPGRRRLTADKLRSLLGLAGQRVVLASSRTGVGVFDTLKTAAKGILLALKRGATSKRPAAKQGASKSSGAK